MSQKRMDVPRQIVYKGLTFGLQTSGRYYQSYNKNLPERLLHRYVWWDHNGDIPEGHVIHHKDEDWTNNDISNLELMGRSEHFSMHAKKSLGDSERRKKIFRGLSKAREAAKEWHASEEGKRWHSEHGKKTRESIGKNEFRSYCFICGGLTITRGHTCPRKYCSQKCADIAQNAQWNAARVLCKCGTCGLNFWKQKYATTKYCSQKCRTQGSMRARRDVQSDSA